MFERKYTPISGITIHKVALYSKYESKFVKSKEKKQNHS